MRSTLIRTLNGRTADGSPLKDLHFAFVLNDQYQVIEVRNYEFQRYQPEDLYSVRQNVVFGEIKRCQEQLKELRWKMASKNSYEKISVLQERVSSLLERISKLEQDDSIVANKRIQNSVKKKREKVGGIYID